ncbi:MAG: hypothetical protein ABW210_05370, partial [Achromobacter sp.]
MRRLLDPSQHPAPFQRFVRFVATSIDLVWKGRRNSLVTNHRYSPLATLIDRHIPEEHFLQSTDTKEKTKNTGGAAEHTPLM